MKIGRKIENIRFVYILLNWQFFVSELEILNFVWRCSLLIKMCISNFSLLFVQNQTLQLATKNYNVQFY